MCKNEIPYKIYLSEKELPIAWYNVRAEMKNKPAPLLNPETHKHENSIKCSVRRRLYAHIALKNSLVLLQRFIINLKATTPAAAIN